MSMTDNEIIVNGGNFNNRDINGAFANNVKLNVVNVNDNRVKINAGNGIRSVYGGFTRNGTASGNKVFINKTTIGGLVYGSYVDGNGVAKNNEVTITDATVNESVSGGYVQR
ncbi:hypothetical protein AGMMS49921_10440 [Endomicrobiia bacterium]|nr:hypothetical protein AGMMS49921_10440 [Endomicrobiia bacterium]